MSNLVIRCKSSYPPFFDRSGEIQRRLIDRWLWLLKGHDAGTPEAALEIDTFIWENLINLHTSVTKDKSDLYPSF